MAVHFKFRSAVNFDKIIFDGDSISIRDLKLRIAEHKNLSQFRDFDLVITDAVTGKEYDNQNATVPNGTRVIIKRVPAAVQNSVEQRPDVEYAEKTFSFSDLNNGDISECLLMPGPANDDFGELDVDLYSNSELERCVHGNDNLQDLPVETNTAMREAKDTSFDSQYFVSITAEEIPFEGNIQKQFSRNGNEDSANLEAGEHEKSTTHQGFLFKKPCSQIVSTQSKSDAPQKVIDLTTEKQHTSELSSELKCSVCYGVFHEAVMIPCCQFSFCNECIKKELLEKGYCPQCGSRKFKVDDLLPNVALRQAIDRFLESQSIIRRGEECDGKNAPDGESAIRGKGSLSHASTHKQGNKRTKALHASNTGTATVTSFGKSRKIDRCCYSCGSLGHLARNCPDRNIGYSQTRMYHAGTPVYPGNAVTCSSDAYWHRTSFSSMPAFPNAYGSSPAIPFEAPFMPVGQYGISPYIPAFYPGVPMHCPFMQTGVTGHSFVSTSERPLSREEFIQLQNFQKGHRLAEEHEDRERRESESNDISSYEEEYELDRDSEPNYLNRRYDQNCRKTKNNDSRRKIIERKAHHKGMPSSEKSDDEKKKLRYLDEFPQGDDPESDSERNRYATNIQKACHGKHKNLSVDKRAEKSFYDKSRQLRSNSLKGYVTSSRENFSDRSISDLEDDDNDHERVSLITCNVSGSSKYDFNSSTRKSSAPTEKSGSERSSDTDASQSRSRKYGHRNWKHKAHHKEPSNLENLEPSKEQRISRKLYGNEICKRELRWESHTGNHKRRQSQSKYEYGSRNVYSESGINLEGDEKYEHEKTIETESNIVDESDLNTSRHISKLKRCFQENVTIHDSIEEGRWQMNTGLDSEFEDMQGRYHRIDKYGHSQRKKEK